MTTNFAPTSLCEILPSGDTRDRVIPGILRVVAGGLTLGVAEPEFCRIGGLFIHQQLNVGLSYSKAGLHRKSGDSFKRTALDHAEVA